LELAGAALTTGSGGLSAESSGGGNSVGCP
jgi:hypothetical protein